LKVQNEYDQIPSGLLDRLKRILPFANIVADKIVEDKIVCEETDLLEEIIPRMYEVMHRVARVSYDYVKHGGSSHGNSGKYSSLQRERQAGRPTRRRSRK